jgi:hypothetical protein
MYRIGLSSLLYELCKKLISKIDNNKFKYFGLKKKHKNKYVFPFIIKESLNDEIPIEIIIDDKNLTFKRLKKYILVGISITTWIRNTAKKIKKGKKHEDEDDSLMKSIIDECESNGWLK